MIRFQAIYGLCNRMRGIVGAIELARVISRGLELYWIADKDLPAEFNDLFENIKVSKSKKIKSKLALVYNKSSIKNLFLPKIIKVLTKQKIFSEHKIHSYIEQGGDVVKLAKSHTVFNFKSYLNVCYTSQGYDIFVPVKRIRNQIDIVTARFDNNTYGVHIRRSDNMESISYSPDELFLEEIRSVIAINPLSLFYIASDDLDIKKLLIAEFGDKIITNIDVVTRNSVKDVERAVVELYALSKTVKIYGSYWSSFSETAAYIGNVELKLLKVNQS
jgi:uncharacterized ubiquitin-like protein YukD